MRQVVTSAKGRPVIGLSSCIVRSDDGERENIYGHHQKEDEMDCDSEELRVFPDRRRRAHSPKSK